MLELDFLEEVLSELGNELALCWAYKAMFFGESKDLAIREELL